MSTGTEGGYIAGLYEQLDNHRIEYKKYLSKYKAPTTTRTYEYAVRCFLNYLEENQLDYSRDSVQSYIDDCTDRGLSASTVNKIYRALRSFSVFTGTEDVTDKLRVVKMPDYRNQAPKSLRKIQVKSLLEKANKNEGLRNICIITTLLNTGIRVSELVGINRDDLIIVEDEGEVRIRQGKGNKERTLPLNQSTRDILTAYLDSRDDDDPALFLGKKGRLGVRGVQLILKKYGIHPHQLRHTFITDLVRKYDLILVQFLSGHASADILSRYSKPTKEDLQSAVESIYN